MPEYGKNLPPWVIEYLESCDVDPNDLRPNVHAVFASLGQNEVALLKRIGNAMATDHFDQAKAARIH